MIKMDRQKYPIGIQTFSEIRERGMLYVDKTDYIWRLTQNFKYVFLSRPRRFGKSLLASTLHCYFEGRRELFKDLIIEQQEKEWLAYPVLHFDMSGAKHLDSIRLNNYLDTQLYKYEQKYGLEHSELDANNRLILLIQEACRQTGRKVVVLIDEYDAPLLDVVHSQSRLESLRAIMRNFYSPLKMCDAYLRFVFLTGITKFSQMSIFSELNNIKNISMLKEYGAICGITHREIEEQISEGVASLAEQLNVDVSTVLKKLTEMYDGYHFTWPSEDVFNPYSLLNALADGMLDSYWFGSGTPTFLIAMLRQFHVKPQEIGPIEALASSFDAPTEQLTDITPLLYQSGYITIKGYDEQFGQYTLDIPNQEVRIGLMKSLLPNYLYENSRRGLNLVVTICRLLYRDEMDSALRLLQQFLSTIPQCNNTDYEGHYQSLLYTIFSLLGMYVDVEVRTPRGRVDMVLRTDHRLYIVELKLNKSAEIGMEQINMKHYSERFALCHLPIVKVAINFDTETHTLKDWKIE